VGRLLIGCDSITTSHSYFHIGGGGGGAGTVPARENDNFHGGWWRSLYDVERQHHSVLMAPARSSAQSLLCRWVGVITRLPRISACRPYPAWSSRRVRAQLQHFLRVRHRRRRRRRARGGRDRRCRRPHDGPALIWVATATTTTTMMMMVTMMVVDAGRQAGRQARAQPPSHPAATATATATLLSFHPRKSSYMQSSASKRHHASPPAGQIDRGPPTDPLCEGRSEDLCVGVLAEAICPLVVDADVPDNPAGVQPPATAAFQQRATRR
jgi:hypothetical protein